VKADLDMSLIHDGQCWVGCYGTLVARGFTLAELDEDVRRVLRASGKFPEGSRVTVFMGFDYDTIPTWIRQYATHYFNRYVAIDL
jgi:hypothetical protein